MRCKKNVRDLKSHKNKILFPLQKLHDHAKRGNFSSRCVLDSSSWMFGSVGDRTFEFVRNAWG